MRIETKFNIGDKVYILDKKIINFVIRDMEVAVSTVSGGKPTCFVIYFNVHNNRYNEESIYTTKQEAGEAWMEKNGLKAEIQWKK